MIQPRTVLRTLAMAAAVLAAACTDDSGPTSPATPPSQPLSSARQGPSDDPNALGRAVAGFGGFFFDAAGTPTIYLTDPGRRGLAEQALAPFLQAQGLSPSRLAVRRGDFDYGRLESWFSDATPMALAVPGAVFADLDEASNRLRIGVEHAAALNGVRHALAARGVPATAVIVEQTEPIRNAATLRNKVRPVRGGLQINFLQQFLCSLGFNAVRNGVNSFITASHCSQRQGGNQSTKYFQPLSTTPNSFIGTEVSDPAYLSGIAGCPAGRRCRFSDALRASYAAGVTFTRGGIEKTTGVNNGSVTIAGTFTIGSEGGGAVGTKANKVGRTTGWSQGNITNTCVTVNVSGTTITQICQNVVSAKVGAGDSGSPVFLGAANATVKLAGILWGSNASGTLFFYSPMSGIEKELGALTTF